MIKTTINYFSTPKSIFNSYLIASISSKIDNTLCKTINAISGAIFLVGSGLCLINKVRTYYNYTSMNASPHPTALNPHAPSAPPLQIDHSTPSCEPSAPPPQIDHSTPSCAPSAPPRQIDHSTPSCAPSAPQLYPVLGSARITVPFTYTVTNDSSPNKNLSNPTIIVLSNLNSIEFDRFTPKVSIFSSIVLTRMLRGDKITPNNIIDYFGYAINDFAKYASITKYNVLITEPIPWSIYSKYHELNSNYSSELVSDKLCNEIETETINKKYSTKGEDKDNQYLNPLMKLKAKVKETGKPHGALLEMEHITYAIAISPRVKNGPNNSIDSELNIQLFDTFGSTLSALGQNYATISSFKSLNHLAHFLKFESGYQDDKVRYNFYPCHLSDRREYPQKS